VHGFSRTWIRTDYTFEDIEEAVELTGFFFGEELAHQVDQEHRVKLPECAGVWWLHN
jgi:hypothetical protein